ncbi:MULTISPECIES: ABC transporter permease [unclassified Pseudactinotalea]|uniref:ABC transporter permease n=1 Tax=Micrococcales TaxID=85006 RepID=UPI003C7BDB01
MARSTVTLVAPRAGPALSVLAPVVAGISVLLGWELLAWSLDSRSLPAPSALGPRLLTEWREGGLAGYATTTMAEALLGCLIGFMVAVPLGYLIARSAAVSAALGPYVAATQAIPAVALAPLLVLWIGYGLVPIALLCALLVFFPILINTTLGLTTLDPDVIDAARVDGAGRGRLLWHIEAPLALPSLLAGVRNGFVLSVTGAVVGEFVMGGQGLGMLLTVYRDRQDTAGLFAVLIALSVLAMTFFFAIRYLERRLRW